MAGRGNDWKTLNAFVDGELPPQDAADIAASASFDPQLSAQIHLLRKVKDGTRAAFTQSAPVIDVPFRKRHRMFSQPAIAASLAGLLLIAGTVVWFAAANLVHTPNQAALLAAARNMHGDWLERDATNAEQSSLTVLAALSGFGSLPVIPDLEGSGLSVSLVSIRNETHARVLQIGYRGRQGCHLSLFVVRDGGGFGRVSSDTSVRESAHAWQVDNIGYLLIARGMDTSRFGLIAGMVEDATRSGSPLGPNHQKLLAENKRSAESCKA